MCVCVCVCVCERVWYDRVGVSVVDDTTHESGKGEGS